MVVRLDIDGVLHLAFVQSVITIDNQEKGHGSSGFVSPINSISVLLPCIHASSRFIDTPPFSPIKNGHQTNQRKCCKFSVRNLL